jgi:dihydroneopterin aldolase
MKLQLGSLEVLCIIGDLPHEREVPQRLTVDVEMDVPDDAAATDFLEDTVDYASLSARIREALVRAACRMIERAAKLAADVCLDDPKVASVKVKVTKYGSVEGLGFASAVWEESR